MKILIVEDDTFFQQFYSYKLQTAGYEVDIAKNGLEGLTKVVQGHPDLVLLDLIMPEKTGFEVLEALQRDPALNHIPVLVFSTLGQEEDQKKALNLGARGYVNKSFFDFDTLVGKIKEISTA